MHKHILQLNLRHSEPTTCCILKAVCASLQKSPSTNLSAWQILSMSILVKNLQDATTHHQDADLQVGHNLRVPPPTPIPGMSLGVGQTCALHCVSACCSPGMCCVRRGTLPRVPELVGAFPIILMGVGSGPEFSAVPAKRPPHTSSPLFSDQGGRRLCQQGGSCCFWAASWPSPHTQGQAEVEPTATCMASACCLGHPFCPPKVMGATMQSEDPLLLTACLYLFTKILSIHTQFQRT